MHAARPSRYAPSGTAYRLQGGAPIAEGLGFLVNAPCVAWTGTAGPVRALESRIRATERTGLHPRAPLRQPPPHPPPTKRVAPSVSRRGAAICAWIPQSVKRVPEVPAACRSSATVQALPGQIRAELEGMAGNCRELQGTAGTKPGHSTPGMGKKKPDLSGVGLSFLQH
jgi:hypothetical protein